MSNGFGVSLWMAKRTSLGCIIEHLKFYPETRHPHPPFLFGTNFSISFLPRIYVPETQHIRPRSAAPKVVSDSECPDPRPETVSACSDCDRQASGEIQIPRVDNIFDFGSPRWRFSWENQLISASYGNHGLFSSMTS